MGNCQTQTTFDKEPPIVPPQKMKKMEKKPVKKMEKKPEKKMEKKPEKKMEKKPEKKMEKKPVKKMEKKPVIKMEKKPEKKMEKKKQKEICDILKDEMRLGSQKILNPKTLRLLKKDGRTTKEILQGCQTIPKDMLSKYQQKQKQIQSKL